MSPTVASASTAPAVNAWPSVLPVQLNVPAAVDDTRRDAGERDAGERRAREVDPGERDAGERRAVEVDPGERDAGERRRCVRSIPASGMPASGIPASGTPWRRDADHRLARERVGIGAAVTGLGVDVGAPGRESSGPVVLPMPASGMPASGMPPSAMPASGMPRERARGEVEVVERDRSRARDDGGAQDLAERDALHRSALEGCVRVEPRLPAIRVRSGRVERDRGQRHAAEAVLVEVRRREADPGRAGCRRAGCRRAGCRPSGMPPSGMPAERRRARAVVLRAADRVHVNVVDQGRRGAGERLVSPVIETVAPVSVPGEGCRP